MRRLLFVIGILIISSGVFADISISEPNSVYNLGDRLYVDLGGLRGVNNGNLDIDLKCENTSINMVRIPGRAFPADQDSEYSIPYKVLDSEDLGVVELRSIIGSCQVVASLGGEVASSKSFEISDDAVVGVAVDKDSYNPGESVFVSIDSVKKNGVSMNGFFESLNSSGFINGVIEEGVAETSFNIGETSEAGVYYLRVHAYDVGAEGVMNEGYGVVSYVVNQVATSLILSLGNTVAVPGENFSVGVEVFDQAGVDMGGSVLTKIVSPEGNELESVVMAGDFVNVDFPTNASVGTWKILAQFNDLAVERDFEMAPLQKVDFDFEDSVLVVKNVGNVLYNKSIDVNIGEEVMHLDLNIDVGESRKFSLEAPVGTYEVKVGDGDYEVSRQVLLTGNAISVSDFKGRSFSNYSLVWIFLIIVFAGIGIVLFVRYRKTRKLGEDGGFFDKFSNKFHKHKERGNKLKKQVEKKVPSKFRSQIDESLNFTKKSPLVQSLDESGYGKEDKTMVDFTRKGAMSAESSLVMKGEKQVSGVVALNVKNFRALGENGKNSLIELVENFKGKGLVDYREEYIFVLFNPLITRTYNNERLAVKCAMSILEGLNLHNKKFRDKVEFGIGVNSGDLVASKNGNRLRYTGIGNTISFAKRMSDVDSGNVLVSEVVRKKLIRDLKIGKTKEIGEKKAFVVGSVRDGAGDAEKLRQILKKSDIK